jgi:dihydrofolate reductase
MSEVVLQMSVSVDGFVASPQGGLGGSIPEDDEQINWKVARVREVGTHIMGRVTYEQMAAYWPSQTDAYAAPMNNGDKVVFSSSLTDPTWAHTRVASGNLADEIAELKRQSDRDIMAHGGAAFVQSLSQERLIDEYRLVIEPVALGGGLPMFKDLPAALRFNLVEAKSFGSGAVAHVYRPAA